MFQQLTGINLIIFYSSKLFSNGNRSPAIPNMIFSLLNMIFSFISGTIVDKLGRKILYLIGSGLMAIFLIITGIFFKDGDLSNSNYMLIVILI